MSITDNKILSGDMVGKKLSDRPDDFDGDPDVSKLWWDAPTDVITDKFNALIDSLDSVAGIVTVPSGIASATSNKGSYDGTVAIGSLVWVVFANGNTASSPTITIGGDSLSFSGIPTIAKLSGSANQTYQFKRTANQLVFVSSPNYECEYGTSGNWQYSRKAGGGAKCYNTTSNSTGAITMTEIANGIYKSAKKTLSLPSGLFGSVNYTANPSIFSESYILDVSVLYDECTAGSIKYQIKKGGSSDSDVSFRLVVEGSWK